MTAETNTADPARLGLPALNRATLDRQLPLRRHPIADEGSRLLTLAAPAAAHDVRFEGLARGPFPAHPCGDLR